MLFKDVKMFQFHEGPIKTASVGGECGRQNGVSIP